MVLQREVYRVNRDALTILNDGRIFISTFSTVNVTGVDYHDEDLLAFTSSQVGDVMIGTWSLYFDGSDVGLGETSNEDVVGVWVDPANGEIYLTTLGVFAVTGLSGDGADLFICKPGTLGTTTSCTYRMFWDGSTDGFAGEVTDAVEIGSSPQLAASADLIGATTTEPNQITAEGAGENREEVNDKEEDAAQLRVYLLYIQR